jgi:hypothetical protein
VLASSSSAEICESKPPPFYEMARWNGAQAILAAALKGADLQPAARSPGLPVQAARQKRPASPPGAAGHHGDPLHNLLPDAMVLTL